MTLLTFTKILPLIVLSYGIAWVAMMSSGQYSTAAALGGWFLAFISAGILVTVIWLGVIEIKMHKERMALEKYKADHQDRTIRF